MKRDDDDDMLSLFCVCSYYGDQHLDVDDYYCSTADVENGG